MVLIVLEDIARAVGLTLAAAAAAYLALALWSVRRFGRRRLAAPTPGESLPGVTVLKPLYGEEAELEANLQSFLTQAYPGPVQIVFGVQSDTDPALAVARRLAERFDDRARAAGRSAPADSPRGSRTYRPRKCAGASSRLASVDSTSVSTRYTAEISR